MPPLSCTFALYLLTQIVVSAVDSSYNQDMKAETLHSWHTRSAEAFSIQRELAMQVSRENQVTTPHFIAGVDMSAGKARSVATGAVVVLEYPRLRVVEVQVAKGVLDLPYIPGLLSFRESPLMLAAFEKLTVTPDLILVDGQGIAHPRRLGLASHLGLFLNTPTIGCAKSLLCGQHEDPGFEPGSYAEIMRTKHRVKPVYVSIGHKVDLKAAIHWVLACCRGYRLPEPTRLAHLAAGGSLKP